MAKQENFDEWVEAPRGFSIIRWGEAKEDDNPAETIVIKKGEFITGLVTKMEAKEEDGEVKHYLLTLKVKDHPEPVTVWSNASFFKDLLTLNVAVGSEILLKYEKDYIAKNGKDCKAIKLRVKQK